jgi:hypothetical protein
MSVDVHDILQILKSGTARQEAMPADTQKKVAQRLIY